MNYDNKEYDKLLETLRKSKPVLFGAEEIEETVLRRVSKLQGHNSFFSEIMELLFSWVYVGWVRRSLITVSAMLVVFFIYQQSVILKQLNYLSRQTIHIEGSETSFSPSVNIEHKLLLYKFSGRKFSKRDITISEEDLNRLLDSLNKIELQYEDLRILIDEDPELKEYVEKKLMEKDLNVKL